MSPVTTIFYCVINSVFFLSEQADKGQLLERNAQRSDNYTPARYIWYEGELSACGVYTHVIVTLTRQSDLVTMI